MEPLVEEQTRSALLPSVLSNVSRSRAQQTMATVGELQASLMPDSDAAVLLARLAPAHLWLPRQTLQHCVLP